MRKASPPPTGKTRPLAAKAQRFIDEYLIDLNATAAYKRAGYKATGNAAEVGASQLIRNPKVAEEIAKRKAQTAQKLQITREEALDEAWRIVKADPRELIEYRRFACQDCYDDLQPGERREPRADCPTCHGEGLPDVLVKDTRKLSRNAQALYAGIKITKDGLEVKMHSKLDALEKVFRHLGMYDADKPPPTNVSVSVGNADDLLADLPPGEAYLVMVQGKR